MCSTKLAGGKRHDSLLGSVAATVAVAVVGVGDGLDVACVVPAAFGCRGAAGAVMAELMPVYLAIGFGAFVGSCIGTVVGRWLASRLGL